MRIASVTMIGQFPDGIGLHVRNLRWALSEQDHIYIVTRRRFLRDFGLRNDERTTYIDFGDYHDIQSIIPFWKHFPRLLREQGIDPEWFLFMEQDIWFVEPIKGDPFPDPQEIRGYLPLFLDYHAVMVDQQLFHPRVWEGGTLLSGALVQRAIDFGIDFSAHKNWFLHKDKGYWDRLAGGRLSFSEYEDGDNMDEFTLYCALVEKTRMTHVPRAIHLQGPETVHRNNPELYRGSAEERLQAVVGSRSYYFCLYGAIAAYFIAGNWQREADWKRMQRHYRPKFQKLVRTAREWMTAEEFHRLEKIATRLAQLDSFPPQGS
jgi:hypothetical protein